MASSSQPFPSLPELQPDVSLGRGSRRGQLPAAPARAGPPSIRWSTLAWHALARRLFDAILALTALLLLAPLLLLLALVIRLDSAGPVLFRQTRTGLNGRTFKIYKFRTMHVLEDGPEIRQVTFGDARVTPMGRILRRTHLDELPQLLNVLWGDMALVGPRPHALAHDTYYAREIPAYDQRFRVKPGMTGWAQVNGARGATPTLDHMRRRIELDLWYVERRSLWLDLTILTRTLKAVRKETGVH